MGALIRRILFAAKMGWRYRRQLANFQKDAALQCPTLFSLNVAQLKREGVSVLVLDFDGVLVSHGEERLATQVLDWLQESIKQFDKDKVFILTNRPSLKRQQSIAEQLPDLQWLHSPRKKPYPEGILKILEITQASPHAVLVVDDRLLTGILAALIAGTQARWITKPFIALRKRPWSEMFFIALRWGERWLLR